MPEERAGLASSSASSGGQIDDQQTIDARARSVGAQPFASVMRDRVEIAEENQRNLRLFANIGDHRENSRERAAAGQPACGGALIGGTVGHRIGKGHTQFDQIGAARFQFQNQTPRDIEVGIAGDDVGNECAVTAVSADR